MYVTDLHALAESMFGGGGSGGVFLAEPKGKRCADQFAVAETGWHHTLRKKIRSLLSDVPGLVDSASGGAAFYKNATQAKATATTTPAIQQHARLLAQALSTGINDGRPPVAPKKQPPKVHQTLVGHTALVDDFIAHSFRNEVKFQPNPHYLELQPEIDTRRRLILVDWMVEVVEDFGMGQETLFLAFNFLDRFLSAITLPRRRLQLLGVTCLWLAAKCDEVLPPVVEDLVEVTDNTYTVSQVLDMERQLLATLRFELWAPSPHTFLEQYAQAAGLDAPIAALASYFLELAVLDPDMLHFLPSQLACSAVYLAALTLTRDMLAAAHTPLPYPMRAVATCMSSMRIMHAWASTAREAPAIRDKYSSARRHHVAQLGPVPDLSCLRHMH